MAKRKPHVQEEVIRREVRKALLFQLGFDVYHPADSGATFDARPDLVTYDAPLVVECKIFAPLTRDDPTFNVGEIRYNQRRWMETWVEYRKRDGYFAIGTTAKNPLFPTRKIWVIPWHEWVSFELNTKRLGTVETVRDVPFTVYASMVDKVFWDRALIGTPTQGYKFPANHPIISVRGGRLPSWLDFKDYTCLLWPDETSPKKETNK